MRSLTSNGTFRSVATILALLLAGLVGAVGTAFAYSSQVTTNTNDIKWLKEAVARTEGHFQEIKELLTQGRR